jgi:DNA helicase-2/ATP-dependent DNA helicase PcrA
MEGARLNPPQLEAVTHTGGPLLVVAGAGSGKTRVITHRIAHLVRERGVDPRHVAALTFTNKAAAEMRARVAQLVGRGGGADKLTMGTFHSLGLHILQRERAALGFPRGFVVYDTADQMGVVREILRHMDAGDRRYDARSILTRISLAKNAFRSPEELESAGRDDYDSITAEIYPRYQAALRGFAALDFDDLITEPVRLLREQEEVRERWSSAFRHLLVDEYQDTNRSQLLLVKELCARHDNLCAVGDDDQSIYSWRGADPGQLRDFERDFPGARVVVLDQNYRSTPTILAAANGVIENNRDRRGKVLWSALPDGPPVAVVNAPSPEEEARFVAQEIARLNGDGRPFRHVAVLYRSNIQNRELEEALRTSNIPYVMYGGQQFFERKEVKDVIAYMKVALSERDEISLRRIINYPGRGIGPTTIDKLTQRAHAGHTSLWRAVVDGSSGLGGEVRSAQADALGGLVAAVAALRAAIESGAVDAAVRQLIETIDLYGDLRAASVSLTAAQRRIDNIETLIRQLTAQQARKPGRDALLEYLRHLSLADVDDGAREDSGDKVVLTTLHGAKGLEFPVVFLIGWEEEMLPHARSLMPHVNDVSDPDHVSDVSEERRLAYVGLTRAQEMLYVTRCASRRRHGKQVPCTPSRFLLEIPEQLMEFRDVAAEAREPVHAGELSAFFQKFATTE